MTKEYLKNVTIDRETKVEQIRREFQKTNAML